MSDSESISTSRNRSGTKRRARNISNLNAQQIQHKRDLDRKAQRALRERVKFKLQDLEDDLARAKASSTDREQKTIEEIQSLREQNRKLKSCLESIGQFAFEGVSNFDIEGRSGGSRTPKDRASSTENASSKGNSSLIISVLI